ncbi:unnamed protein product [Kuraishia capsulata CBS 1993]|uniref:Protein kinase domain-containing protein n=1 Tax=Kuraishia capsulata CBS 1993 TaxID=1382522 RepID=W6MNB2_9ASCO|nr:uncharacterized protein KUCA_T00004082001 [Kuraishia capsulata CBS 1993]CDK28101.1 unnamed protein product [Kuraishia capsulata CBS 1993]
MSLFRSTSKSSASSSDLHHYDMRDESSSLHSSASNGSTVETENGHGKPRSRSNSTKSKWRSFFGSSSSLKQDASAQEQLKQDKLRQQQLDQKLRSQVEHPGMTSHPYSPSQYPVPVRNISGRKPNAAEATSRRPSADDKASPNSHHLAQPHTQIPSQPLDNPKKLSPLNVPSSPAISFASEDKSAASSPGVGPTSPCLVTGLGVMRSKNNSTSSFSDGDQVQRIPPLKTSPSNSDLNGALNKLKLMPAVMENHLDDILDEESSGSQKSPNSAPIATAMSRNTSKRESHSASSANMGELSRSASRGRSSRLVHKFLGHGNDSDSRDSSSPPPFDNDVSLKRSNTISMSQLEAYNSHNAFFNNLKHSTSFSGLGRANSVKTMKRDGCIISYLEGTSLHYHDYCKLKKNLARTGGGIWGWKKTKDDSSPEASIENSISLIPDSYSEQLMVMKSKPENYRWNYEDLEDEDDNEDEDGDSGDDSSDGDDYDSEEDIEPIIGPDQLKLCNSMLDKIEHSEKLNKYIENNAGGRLPLCKKYGKIKGLIGKGSYGTVKLAMKINPDKSESVFAIKHLKQRANESPHHFGNRVTSEFMIASSLTHQAVINTYDLMIDPETLTYSQVMEFVPCGDLYSLINSTGGEGLSMVEADCFFKQILNAITYLHSVGISHNDLKVENLLLTSAGQLKIIDFGTSAVFKTSWEPDVQKSRGACGSEPYVAPEEYISDNEYDPRYADVWSLGIIYLIMVNGGYVWSVAKKSDDLYAKYLDTRALYNYDKKSSSHTQEAAVVRAGQFDPIESLGKGQFPHSRRYVLYNILNPDPNHRMRVSKIWKSEWVKSIQVCDAGRGFVDSHSFKLSTVMEYNGTAMASPHLSEHPTARAKSPNSKATSPKME